MHTLTIEVTPKEKNDVVRALRSLADEEDGNEQPGVADQLRGLASRIERE
ncbi:MAG TPA: hypothetical protein VFJ06_10930 [Halococcus sp.]|nr:hypothetical protein [Halococcus sp.]